MASCPEADIGGEDCCPCADYLRADLARVTAERDRANREREAENLRAFRLEARLYDLGPTPCTNRTDRCLMGPHGVGCECAERDRDRWGSAPFPVRTMQEVQAENARLRAALEAFAAEGSWHPKYIGTWDRPEWQWRWARPEHPRDFAKAALAGEAPNAD